MQVNRRPIQYKSYERYIQKQLPEVFCKKKPEACNFIKKETLAQVLSCEFCIIFKNIFFTEHLWTTASLHSYPF